MNAEKHVLEVRGVNVEKAVEAGLAQLGLTRNDVVIEVLDEGSSGFLGIGSRDASVRLTVKEVEPIEEAVEAPATGWKSAPSKEESEPAVVAEQTAVAEPDVQAVEDVIGEPGEDVIALEVVNNLLSKMQVEAQTRIELSEPDDLTGERRWVVQIKGNDLGVLIGPRGETLNALQYISRLMTSHSFHQRTHFIIDVEGYRDRREQALARLAERMADKVVSNGKPLNLEPMPPNERRIIHMTLREHSKVYTQSRGEGNRRQVRILLK
jgi:spoIIIJ-associated protein